EHMSANELIRLLFDAAALGSLLFLVSAGMSMIFGLMRIVNVAHGSFYLLGAYIAFGMLKVFDNQLLAYIVAIAAVTVFGALLYAILIDRVSAQPLRQILLTFGVVLVVGDIALTFWRGVPAALPIPEFLNGQLRIGPLTFPFYRLFVIGLGLAIA